HSTFVLYCTPYHSQLHSFPTRRSSDLDILTRIIDSYNHIGEVPENTKLKDKMQTWVGIQLNTMTDQSNSKLSEMLIQGTTMGIIDRKSTRLNSSHVSISYAVFCLKKKT